MSFKSTPYTGPALVKWAEEFAIHHHGEQVDKVGRPYKEHLQAVSEGVETLVDLNLVRPFGKPYDGNVYHLQAAGWLHDVVEDTKITFDDLLDLYVPKPVLAIVAPVTKRPGEDQVVYLGRVINAGPPAWITKLADLYNNTMPRRVSVKADDGRFIIPGDSQVRLLTKYVRAIKVLEALLEVPPGRRRGWYTEQHLLALKRQGYKDTGASSGWHWRNNFDAAPVPTTKKSSASTAPGQSLPGPPMAYEKQPDGTYVWKPLQPPELPTGYRPSLDYQVQKEEADKKTAEQAAKENKVVVDMTKQKDGEQK